MSYTVEHALESLRNSRKFFLKHLAGLKEEQWTWKPYPECKNVIETLAHLICDDRAAYQSLQSGKEPDYESLVEAETDRDILLAKLDESHAALCGFILDKWGNAPVDTEICVWGSSRSLAAGLSLLTSEDYYHAGQVAYIRCATEPSWDYYASIYGG